MDTTLQDPLVGQTLDGRYRVETRIAVGGMATVYRAVDTRLDRVLALKVMHPGLAADSGFVHRFIREAKAVARLAHPNVVGVFDQGTDGTYVYLAMEYIAGCTLRDVLRERGALQPRAALDILEPVLAALGAAHRAGLVHRDMKPENVLIGDDGRVKVADFGLVRAVDTNTTSIGDGVLGTASYMAPEQIESGTTDPRTDVYACGLVLYEMLTGAKPYAAENAVQAIYRRLNEDIAPPSAAVPGLAPELDRLVASAAARDAARRPADAVGLLAAVHAVRQALGPEQLDAVPPAALPVAAVGAEEPTTAIARTAPTDPTEALNRTAFLATPPPPPPAPGRRRGPVAVIAVLLLILGLAGGVWYVADGQFTTTPAVLNETRATAEHDLRAEGLKTRVVSGFSETVAKGRVISTDPGPGKRVRDHGTVTVTVSKGPERVRVPDLAGKPLATARKELRQAGLTPGKVTRAFSDEEAAGDVIATDPDPGSRRSKGTTVALTVSKGQPVDVPDVVGESEDEARQDLEDAGLKVKVAAGTVYSDEADAGAVAAQKPGPDDAEPARGDTVTLTLSKGPQMVEVPDVEGKDADEAKQILQDAGFDVRVIQYFFTGKVTSQSPGAGKEAAKGSTITLWVS